MNLVILAALSALLTSHAHAGDSVSGYVALPEDAAMIAPAEGSASVMINSFVYPNCPVGGLCMPMSQVRIDLRFRLDGCLDELGPATYATSLSEDGRKVTVYVSATKIARKASILAMCAAIPEVDRTIELNLKAGVQEAEVKFLTRVAEE